MTTIEEHNGKPTITYQIPGSAAEYTAHLKAVAAAVAVPSLDEENRQTLGGMLIQMLPTEDQVNLKAK